MNLNKAKLLLFFFLLLFLAIPFQGRVPQLLQGRVGFVVFADDLSDQINAIQKQITDLENAISPLKKESTGLQSKIT